MCAFSYAVYHELIVTTHHATYMFSLNLRWGPTLFLPQKMIVIQFTCLFVLLKKKREKKQIQQIVSVSFESMRCGVRTLYKT